MKYTALVATFLFAIFAPLSLAQAQPSAVAKTPQDVLQELQQKQNQQYASQYDDSPSQHAQQQNQQVVQQQTQQPQQVQQPAPEPEEKISIKLEYTGFEFRVTGGVGFGVEGLNRGHFRKTYGGISGGFTLSPGYRFWDGYFGVYLDVGYNDIEIHDDVENDYVLHFLPTVRLMPRLDRVEFIIGFGLGPVYANFENTQKPYLNNSLISIWGTKIEFAITYYINEHIYAGISFQPLFVNSGSIDHLENFADGTKNSRRELGHSWVETPPFEDVYNLHAAIGFRL